jgi:hypothetical protein
MHTSISKSPVRGCRLLSRSSHYDIYFPIVYQLKWLFFVCVAAAAAATRPAAAAATMSKTWICWLALLLWQLLGSSAINGNLNRMTQALLCLPMQLDFKQWQNICVLRYNFQRRCSWHPAGALVGHQAAALAAGLEAAVGAPSTSQMMRMKRMRKRRMNSTTTSSSSGDNMKTWSRTHDMYQHASSTGGSASFLGCNARKSCIPTPC